MTKWRNSFPIRASWRMYVHHGEICPVCGQSNPLLLTKDGLCANCASGNIEEEHHIVSKAFRKIFQEVRQAVVGVSANAHLLLSDLQMAHPTLPSDDLDSIEFWEALFFELVGSLIEMWLVLTYLDERPEIRSDLIKVFAILLGLWFITHLDQFDFTNLVERARIKLYENKA